MKTKSDPRHQSRIVALQKLFEQEFNANSPFGLQELQHINDSHIDESFANALVHGVIVHKQQIDNEISKYIQKRSFEDTAKVDLLILRMAIYELLYESKKIPMRVVIDEAVELGKEFGGNKSFTFINGVLGSISQRLHETSHKS